MPCYLKGIRDIFHSVADSLNTASPYEFALISWMLVAQYEQGPECPIGDILVMSVPIYGVKYYFQTPFVHDFGTHVNISIGEGAKKKTTPSL
mmetsp:Transcript_17161/g.22548  ORF Transcript_17161/g.22548 Transcript_17161/m.22548 type:complete len:92 (+) Transcript_17161:289-564(+)